MAREKDEEKQPLLAKDSPKRAKKEKSISSTTILKICSEQLNQLLIMLDMASMRSPRTQCCCCAIGVFAAMFGIFMLSAGICIVLNVNYMEVDTSGLPPDLHNDDGKKIVGIILICVAIGTLGLSATVSIIYFTICNRSSRPRASVPASSSIANGTAHASSHQPHNSSKHASKTQKGANGSARATPPGSQLSLNQRRHANPSPGDRVMVLASPSVHGQSPPTGQKRGQSRKNMQKVKNHSHSRLKNKSYRFGLPTHTEEDPEAAKSVVDLKSHQKISGETSSSSGSSVAPSQLGSTITDDSRTVSTTSFIKRPMADKAAPVIIINDSTQNTSALPANDESAPSSGKSDSETVGTHRDVEPYQTAEHDAVYHENEFATTADSVTSSSPPPPSSSPFSTSHPHNVSDDSIQTQGYTNPAFQRDNSNMVPVSIGHFETDSMADDRSKNDRFSPSPPTTSGQQTAFPQYPLTGTTSPDAMIPSRSDFVDEQQLTDQDSVSSSNHCILQVKPQNISGIDPNDSLQSTSDSVAAEDRLSDLPPSSRHHDRYTGQSNVTINSNYEHDLDNRSESRSSFNSAFSTDGDDPGREEMQEKLRQLLK